MPRRSRALRPPSAAADREGDCGGAGPRRAPRGSPPGPMPRCRGPHTARHRPWRPAARRRSPRGHSAGRRGTTAGRPRRTWPTPPRGKHTRPAARGTSGHGPGFAGRRPAPRRGSPRPGGRPREQGRSAGRWSGRRTPCDDPCRGEILGTSTGRPMTRRPSWGQPRRRPDPVVAAVRAVAVVATAARTRWATAPAPLGTTASGRLRARPTGPP